MTITITWQIVFKVISTIVLGLFGLLTSYGAFQVKSTRKAGIAMLAAIVAGLIAIWI